MFLALGRRAGQPVNATSLACPKKTTLLYVVDRLSGTRFLVDTAEISVVPRNIATRKVKKQSQRLQAANGSTIPTFSEVSLSMDFGLCWVFTVAAVAIPILGADFLRDNGLLVDLPRHQLHEANTDFTVTSLPCDYEALKLHVLRSRKKTPPQLFQQNSQS